MKSRSSEDDQPHAFLDGRQMSERISAHSLSKIQELERLISGKARGSSQILTFFDDMRWWLQTNIRTSFNGTIQIQRTHLEDERAVDKYGVWRHGDYHPKTLPCIMQFYICDSTMRGCHVKPSFKRIRLSLPVRVSAQQ